MGFNKGTASHYLLTTHMVLIFTRDLYTGFQQMQSILEKLEIFLPAYHSENSQEQIQGFKDKSTFAYAILRALTDFIILPN